VKTLGMVKYSQLHHAFSIGMKMFIEKFKDLLNTDAFLFDDSGACSSI
jgi:hypothetical protein